MCLRVCAYAYTTVHALVITLINVIFQFKFKLKKINLKLIKRYETKRNEGKRIEIDRAGTKHKTIIMNNHEIVGTEQRRNSTQLL